MTADAGAPVATQDEELGDVEVLGIIRHWRCAGH